MKLIYLLHTIYMNNFSRFLFSVHRISDFNKCDNAPYKTVVVEELRGAGEVYKNTTET